MKISLIVSFLSIFGSAQAYAVDANATEVLFASNQILSTSSNVKLGIHLWSKHFPDDKGYSNNNFGGYVQVNDWLGGGFRNSEFRNSFYLAKQFKLYEHIPLYASIGVISGYRPTQKVDVIPFVAPSLLIPVSKQIEVGFTILPPIKGTIDAGVVHSSIQITL